MQATIPREQSIAQIAPDSKVAIAFFTTRAEAQLAVDHLHHGGLRLHQMAIVRDHPRSLEQDSGRSGASRAALQGVIDGTTVGLFMSVAIGLLNIAQPLRAMLSIVWPGVVGGAALGLIIGLIGHAFGGDRRAIPVTPDLARYVVMVDADLSREASRMLEGPY